MISEFIVHAASLKFYYKTVWLVATASHASTRVMCGDATFVAPKSAAVVCGEKSSLLQLQIVIAAYIE